MKIDTDSMFYGERCQCCGDQAFHKIREVMQEPRHEFTAYLCCGCFGNVMGKVAVAWCENNHSFSAIHEQT